METGKVTSWCTVRMRAYIMSLKSSLFSLGLRRYRHSWNLNGEKYDADDPIGRDV